MSIDVSRLFAIITDSFQMLLVVALFVLIFTVVIVFFY